MKTANDTSGSVPSTIAGIPKKKLVCGVLGFVAAFAVYALLAGSSLSTQGAQCLAILVWAIFWWVGGVLPEFATALAMVVGFCLIAGVSTKTAFAAFASDTWWLLVAAFSIGAGMKSCGLMRRMALGIIRVFPKTFAAQAGALMAAGTLIGPLIPSMAAKSSMLAPIAMEMGDALGYERKGRQMQGLFAAMLCGVRTVGPAVVSASVIGYTIWGLMPADVQEQFDMVHWFLAALPWFVPCLALTFGAILLLYAPRKRKTAEVASGAVGEQSGGECEPYRDERSTASAASAENATDTAARPAPSADGAADRALDATAKPFGTAEKRMLAIVVCAVALWMTEPLHGIAAHVVALCALVAMVVAGIIDKKEFRTAVSWESLVFIGVAIGLATVFTEVGIQEWIVTEAGPLFTQLASNPYVFVLAIALFTVAARFVIVSQMAFSNIFLAFMVPLAISAGISPWVVGMALYAAIDPWFALYQNPIYLAAFYAVDGKMVNHGDMAKFCVVYTAICILCLFIAVPFWQGMGLL